MNKILWAFALFALAVGSGCQHHNLASNGCPQCRNGGNGGGSWQASKPPYGGRPPHVARVPRQEETGPPGPLSATYAYPYYTTHGPRDFLMDDPPTLGR